MMTRIRNLVMLLFTFILFSCNGDDNNNSVDSSSVLIKKIQTTWIERYMYLSSEPGTGNPLPVYADADIIAEYTYEEHKLEKIDYKASFSNYSNGISSSSSSMFWQFTYTDDLITKVETYYNDDAPHLQYTFEFEIPFALSAGTYFITLAIAEGISFSDMRYIDRKTDVLVVKVFQHRTKSSGIASLDANISVTKTTM